MDSGSWELAIERWRFPPPALTDISFGYMVCRHCGTEIADKAIICYRCGAGTSDPVRQPARIRRRPGSLVSFVAVAVMLVLALYLGQASRTASDPDTLQTIAGVIAGAAVVLLILRLLRRR